MTKVEALQEQIGKLDHDELAQLAAWIRERDWERRDREIEEGATNDRLDELVTPMSPRA